MAVSHYLNILDRQRDIVIPHVVFGGKNPHPHYIVGGMPCSISMNDMNAPINTQRLGAVEQSIALAKDLVDNFLFTRFTSYWQNLCRKRYDRWWWPCEETRYVLWRLS